MKQSGDYNLPFRRTHCPSLSKNAHWHLSNGRNGMFPLCLGILLMILSGMFVLKIFIQREEQVKKGSLHWISESPLQLILFLGTMVLATLFFNRLDIHSFLSFWCWALKNLGDKKVGSKYSDLCGDVCWFLFCIYSMARHSYAKGMGWIIEEKKLRLEFRGLRLETIVHSSLLNCLRLS